MTDKDILISDLNDISEILNNNGYGGWCKAIRKAVAMLKEQEDNKPKGHWMPYEPDKRGYTDGFTCSRCERVILSDHYCKMIDFDFCPYCGAYMDNAEGL
jgi:hypothetical protein